MMGVGDILHAHRSARAARKSNPRSQATLLDDHWAKLDPRLPPYAGLDLCDIFRGSKANSSLTISLCCGNLNCSGQEPQGWRVGWPPDAGDSDGDGHALFGTSGITRVTLIL